MQNTEKTGSAALVAFFEANLRKVPNPTEHPELCSTLAFEIARAKNSIG